MRRRTSYHNNSWNELRTAGVRFAYGANEENCYISTSVKIERSTIIYPNIIIDGEINIGEDCVIGSGSVIAGKGQVGNGTKIGLNSVVKIENPYIGNDCSVDGLVICSVIESGSIIGKLAKIEFSKIGANCIIDGVAIESVVEFGCNIGPFAEIKRSIIGWCVNAKHHCSIIDAEVGYLTNISAKTQVANFNGIEKRKTKIGPKCMIGVDVNIVGGVEIGEECFIADRARVDKNLDPRTYFNPEKAEKYPSKYRAANDNCAWYLYGNYLVMHFPVPPPKRLEFIKKLEQRFLWATLEIENWLKKPIQVLENKTPLELLKEEGVNIIPCLFEECKCHFPEETPQNPA